MDPFLEHPVFFGGIHGSLIPYLREYLQPRLPEPYFAELADRVWVEVPRRLIEPDVNILRAEEPSRRPTAGNGGVAVATRTQPVVIHVPHEERRETVLEIYARQDDERLVTVVEVLSLTNKTPGEQGRDLYLRKQREVLDSRTNLVEIDLLRGGRHTTAVPQRLMLERTGPLDYHVCIHHFDNLEDYFVYPILLADRLPEIAIPLLPGDPAVTVDLQAVFDRCYDTGPYRRRVRYAEQEVLPALRPEQAEWVTRMLREKGLLPALASP
jgi:hypothetical protein